MDASDNDRRFVNPISESEDDAQKDSGRASEAGAVDPTDAAAGVGAMRTGIKHKGIVEEDLLGELNVSTQDVNMNPLDLVGGCWGAWNAMTCGERLDAIKTVSTGTTH